MKQNRLTPEEVFILSHWTDINGQIKYYNAILKLKNRELKKLVNMLHEEFINKLNSK